ncbi:MAG TPA: DUF5681 domain-containing protein [Hyphomonadaceae bacterium]|nr:DUF5681 domain-containing protein [Hyphomonadaceae bacterium]
MTDDSNDGDYKVGYGKPPKHSRFGPGNRANPRGRPKGSPNLSTMAKRAAREKVTVVEHGRRKTITKIEAAFKQLLTKAAGGDPRAIQLAIEMFDRIERRDSAQPQIIDTVSRKQLDTEILQSLKGRINGGRKTDNDEEL